MNQTRATRTPSAYYVSNYSYNYTAVQTKENGKQKTFNIPTWLFWTESKNNINAVVA